MAVIRERFRLVQEPLEVPPVLSALQSGLSQSAAAIVTLTDRIDAGVLAASPRLKIVANYAVGYNNIDIDAARQQGIVVTNTPDVLTDATADLTWALILATARRVIEGDRLVRSGQWTGWTPTQLLGTAVAGRTLGIIGMNVACEFLVTSTVISPFAGAWLPNFAFLIITLLWFTRMRAEIP